MARVPGRSALLRLIQRLVLRCPTLADRRPLRSAAGASRPPRLTRPTDCFLEHLEIMSNPCQHSRVASATPALQVCDSVPETWEAFETEHAGGPIALGRKCLQGASRASPAVFLALLGSAQKMAMPELAASAAPRCEPFEPAKINEQMAASPSRAEEPRSASSARAGLLALANRARPRNPRLRIHNVRRAIADPARQV